MYDMCWKKKLERFKANSYGWVFYVVVLFFFPNRRKYLGRGIRKVLCVCVWLAGCELVCVACSLIFVYTCLHIQRECVSVVLCALWNTSKIMYDESFEWFKCISKMCALCAAGYVVSRNMINVLMNRMRLNYILKLCLWMCELFASIYICVLYILEIALLPPPCRKCTNFVCGCLKYVFVCH